MNETIKDISETIKETRKNVSEVFNERIFSPMYFYFIISWVFINWKFIYAFFAMDENFREKLKYLEEFFIFETGSGIFISSVKIFFAPAITTFIFVWWFSILSEKFFEKNEQHKTNKRFIKNKILYNEKYEYSIEQRKIRDKESDKNDIQYYDNRDFNKWYDYGKENVKIGEYEFLPSESLYNNDYKAYEENLNQYLNDKKNGKFDDDFDF